MTIRGAQIEEGRTFHDWIASSAFLWNAKD